MKFPAIEPLEARIAPATLSIAPASIDEGNSGTSTLNFTVTLTGEITQNVTVDYATANQSATTADNDYLFQANSLLFTPGGPATQTISISVLGDTVREQDQTFLVNLTGSNGAEIPAGQGQAVGTIVSESGELPTLSINDPERVDEGGTGAETPVNFTVTLDGQINSAITVPYTTRNGTATTADNDYVSKTGTLTFNPGATTQTQTIAVNIKGDGKAENDETFFVDLGTPSGGPLTVTKAAGLGTIRNDELVIITLDNPSIVEGANGETNLVFTATLVGEVAGTATINYATADGTAKTSDNDYTAVQGQIFFDAQNKTRTISVPITGDTQLEQNEQFTLRLTNVRGIVQATGTGTITSDELPTFSIDDPQVIEGTGGGTTNLVFTVSLTGQVTSEAKVNFATSSLTAIAGTDFTNVPNRTLTFTPGQTTQTVSVPITRDAVAELSETLRATLTNATNAAIADAEGTGTILDDEPTAFQIGDATLVEGNDGTSSMIFNVTRTGALTANATVNYATANGTALAGEDFQTTAGTLTFTPDGPTTQAVTVPIVGDAINEADENFFVDLSGAVGANIAKARGAGTIQNDEVSVSISGASIQEGGRNSTRQLVFNVTLSQALVGPATVHFATSNGSATTAGGDYTSTSGTLTFSAGGPLTRTISVPIIGDLTMEGDEFFLTTLSGVTGMILGTNSAQGTILDDERTLTVSPQTPGAVTEGDLGNPPVGFNVTLSAALDYDVVLKYSTAGESATASQDFVPVTDATVTIPAGQTTAAFNVQLIGDLAQEADETFRLQFATDQANLASTQANITIADDDPKLRIGDVTVVEGDAGTQTAIFTVLLSSASDQEVTVTYKTEDGLGETGARGSDGTIARDYVGVASGTLTFLPERNDPNNPSVRLPAETVKTIAITIHNDTVHELAQNFFNVKLLTATAGGAPIIITDDTGLGTIIDNGDAAPTLSVNDAAALENVSGGNLAFTAVLSKKSDLEVTVNYATIEGSAVAGSDFTGAASTLTFLPGETSKAINVALTADGTVEPDEMFSIKLTNAQVGPVGAQQPLVITDDTAVGTIRNDDVTVSIAPTATLVEGGGNMNFTVTLSAPAAADVVVRYSTANGTGTTPAAAPGDFTAAGSQTITILQGETTGTISVPIISDAADEPNENFTVTLEDATNAVLGAAKTSTGTITDDDATPTLSINDVTVTEGNSGTSVATFTVTLSTASFETIKVDYKTEDGAGDNGAKDGVDDTLAQDYQPIEATGGVLPTLTFAPGDLTKTISVNIVGDNIHEALENLFSVKLTNARIERAEPTPDVLVTIADDTGTGTIVDSGDALPVISVADVSVAENGGNAVFTVKLSSVTDLPVTIAYATADNGALAGVDYTATSGTLTFDPIDPTVEERTTLTVTVPILDDATSETEERFFLNLSSPTNASLVDGQAVGRILNDDATFRIEPLDAPGTSAITVDEDGVGKVRFKVILTGAAPGATTTVQYATVAGTAVSSGPRPDFTGTSGTLVFGPTTEPTSEQIIEVPIIADANFETNEQFTIVLSQPANAAIASGTGTVTIANNDARPTLTIENATIVEGNSGTTNLIFKAKLSAANEVETVTAVRETEDGTAISSGDKKDFTALAGSLTFTPGVIAQDITVQVTGDLRDEDDQSFRLNLTNLSGATFAGGAVSLFATGTILDNDDAPFVVIKSVTLGENSQPNAQFEVTLQNAAGQVADSEKVITVDYATLAGTAKAGSDFTAMSGTLTFAPGVTKQFLAVPVLDDLIAEDTESFSVQLANAVNAPLGNTTATATITDNDATSRPAITINDISLTEGDAGTTNAVFTVSLSGATGQLVTVNFATADGTGKATGPFADYLARAGTLTFDPNDPDPAKRLTQTIVVPVIGDLFSEVGETFLVNLSGATSATLGDTSGTATILNGSDTKLGLVLLDAQKVEGSGSNADLTFTAQLSGPATSAVTFTLTTLNGTALAGLDYRETTEAKTIAAGATSATFDVLTGADSEWEATESFFVNLTGASSNVEVVDADPIGAAQATARAYLFNDDINIISNRKIQWIDIDGDLVTMTVNKGSLALTSTILDSDIISLVAEGSVGGRELQRLVFVNDAAAFEGVTLSIVATKQAGFPLDSDGRVDVGWIAGTEFFGDTLQVRGIDFASITVDGDVAKITAGDVFADAAIGKLDVYSLGARGTTTGAPDTETRVIAPITTVHVRQNLEGYLNVVGSEFGSISTLKIDGALKGGAAAGTGVVQTSGRIGSAIVGSIIGGAGANSGLIVADANTSTGIGKVEVLGDIIGGSGIQSGAIVANKIGNVTVGGDIIGGSAEATGLISSNSTLGNVTIGGDVVGGGGGKSGQIFAFGKMGAVRVEGSVFGGAGRNSGFILTESDLSSLKIDGALVGGSGEGSGGVEVKGKLGATTIGENADGDSIVGGSGTGSGTIATFGDVTSLTTAGNIRGGSGSVTGALVLRGKVAKLTVDGDLIGGDAPTLVPGEAAKSIAGSGFIQVGKLVSGLITGDILAGASGAGKISDSASVRAKQIDSLTINGNVLGQPENGVTISALGESSAPAIKNLLIKGNVSGTAIAAGFDVGIRDGAAEKANADASIGNVTINGNVLGVHIVAGADAGADGRFGTADDRLLSGAGVTDVAKTISKIASVIIKGQMLDPGRPFGVVAQHIVSIKRGVAGTIPIPLTSGAGNDIALGDDDPDPGVLIAPNFRAIELPLPA